MNPISRIRHRLAQRREIAALSHAVTYRAGGRYRPNAVVQCSAARWSAITEAVGGDFLVLGRIHEPDGTPIQGGGPMPVLRRTMRRLTAQDGARVRVDLGPAEMGILVHVARDAGDEELLTAIRGAVAGNAFPLCITLD